MEMLPNDPLNLLRHTLECEKRICVIGAGAGGLAALKVISDSTYFKSGKWSIVAYEARTNVGGIWLPAPPVADSDNVPFTPLYDSLTTNLPHPIMGYTSYSFPPETPLFPRAHVVQTYLESYATHFNLMPLIKFGTRVLDVRWESTQWVVTLSEDEHLAYDHLIVANGHYHIPRIPDLPGLADWVKHGKAFHSIWYRRPAPLGDKVLVVGGGPSGQDISAEMCAVASVVVHASSNPDAGAKDHDINTGNLIQRGRAMEFRPNGQVMFDDGTVEDNIDHCILATGFQMHFPFLEGSSMIKKDMPPDIPPLIPGELFNSTYHVFPLEKHIFPLQTRYPVSSVAFMGLVVMSSPFPVMEAQAHAIVRVFADPSSLDHITEADNIIARAEKIRRAGASTSLETAKAWFRLDEYERWSYRDESYEFASGESGTPPIKVAEWEKEYLGLSIEMRSGWERLEKSGKAEEWLKDVGKNGVQDWVELMHRVVEYARN